MSSSLVGLLRSLLPPSSLQAQERARWAPIDPFSSGAYNHYVRRSRTDRDLVRQPDVLWSPAPYWAPREGLSAHVRHQADVCGAVTSDAIILLHPQDHETTRRSLVRDWDRTLSTLLRESWERLVTEHGLVRLTPSRPFRAAVRQDGDPEIGPLLGLARGEFATVLGPNIYLGPDPGSEPLAEIFLCERGQFRSVGTLWNDQVAFHLGAHPMDNGRCEALGDSSLYCLVRAGGDGPLSHRVHSSRADRVRIEVGQSSLGETVRLVDAGRNLLLAELAVVPSRRSDWELPAAGERAAGPRRANDLALPSMGPVAAGGTILPDEDMALSPVSIVPDALPESRFVLSERAVLIQRVHFKAVMAGYWIAVDRSGRLGPRVADPVARIEVTDDRLSLLTMARDLSLDGTPLREGQRTQLLGPHHDLRWRGAELSMTTMTRPDPKWPYLLRVEGPRRFHPLPIGRACTVGRDRSGIDVALPDRPTPENILWRDGQNEGPVQISGGPVERTTFRTDAIFVASRAAIVEPSGSGQRVRNLSGSCPVHVLRSGGECVRLGPEGEVELAPGDEILVGNHVFALLPAGMEDPLPVGRGEVEVAPATIVETRPASGHLEQGPGARGRRPTAGGRAGKLVRSERTLGQILGGGQGEERVPITQVAQLGPPREWPPKDALRTRVPDEAAPSPSPTQRGPETAVYPSISLDPETAVEAPAPRVLPRGLQISPLAEAAAEGSRLRRHRGALPGFSPRG